MNEFRYFQCLQQHFPSNPCPYSSLSRSVSVSASFPLAFHSPPLICICTQIYELCCEVVIAIAPIESAVYVCWAMRCSCSEYSNQSDKKKATSEKGNKYLWVCMSMKRFMVKNCFGKKKNEIIKKNRARENLVEFFSHSFFFIVFASMCSWERHTTL